MGCVHPPLPGGEAWQGVTLITINSEPRYCGAVGVSPVGWGIYTVLISAGLLFTGIILI